MKKASEFIDQIFSQININQESPYISIFSSWEKIAGTDIASHSQIMEIEGTTILISVDHPGWTHLIQLKKKHILFSIKKQFPELKIDSLRIILS